MARDRLAAMRANQKTFESDEQQNAPSLSVQPQNYSQTNQVAIDEKALDIDRFMEQVSDLNNLIRSINDNIDRLRSLQLQSISELDSDRTPRQNSNDEDHHPSSTTQSLIELSSQTSGMIRNCKNRIESLQSSITSSNQPRQNFNVHLTQIGALKKRLMDAISKYQSVEQEYRQKSQARIERQYRIVNPDASPEEIRQVIDSDQSVQIFSQALMTSNRYGDARAAFNEVKERHQQLKRIETTLTELMEMFNDLAIMVEEQDQVIQNVESAAIEVDKDMEQAGQHISKARDSAAAARKKRWICFFIILLLLAIAGAVVAIVVVTNNNKK